VTFLLPRYVIVISSGESIEQAIAEMSKDGKPLVRHYLLISVDYESLNRKFGL